MVEFGIVAILFTLLMFAIVDFGLLLNSWVALSSGTRQVARAATVGQSLAKTSGYLWRKVACEISVRHDHVLRADATHYLLKRGRVGVRSVFG